MSGGGNGRNGPTGRLKGWKAIAAYFGTDERTVKRWETQRGLPVHRVPGGGASVYADVDALAAWMRGSVDATPPVAVEPASPGRRRWTWPVVAAGALGLAAVAVTMARSPGGAAIAWLDGAPSRPAVEAYLAAAHQLEQRTPGGVAQAIDGFGKAIAEEPAYADAHAGLAMAHLLSREFGTAAAEPAYARAAAAAERAVALDPGQAEGHAALGFATFYGRRDFAAGLASLKRAVELDPASGRTLHWYATALYHAGDLTAALTMIERAQRRTPGMPAIVADKALILYARGARAEAIALLDQIARERPEFVAPHRYRALIALAEGDHVTWLRSAARAAALGGRAREAAEIAAARLAYARGGGRALLDDLLARRRLSAPRSHYDEAVLLAVSGQPEAALDALSAALRSGESLVTAMRIDPRLASLHGNRRFADLARQAGGG